MVTFSVLLAAMLSRAEVITWTNTSNGNWSVTNNWSPNRAPSTNDIVVITNDGIYTVTLNVSPTIAGLVLGGSSGTQTLATAGRILTMNGNTTVGTNGVILLSGGTLSGDSRIDLQGTITWNSGVLDTNAVLNIATNGRITMASSSTKYWYGNMTNAGTVEWQPTGGISMYGTFNNLATGFFDAQVDGGAILVSGTNATFINDGLFRKTNGTGNINFYPPLINNGTVDIQTGTLTLRAPSVFNSGCAFTGGGTVNFQAGTNTLNGSIHTDNLTLLYSATLTGTGSFSGTLTWGGGSIGENAAITVATNGQLLIASISQFTKVLNGSLTNQGTITWTPNGNLVLGGVLHNLTNAVFEIQTGNGILASGTNPVFINDGTLRRSVDTFGTSCQVPLINSGTVDIQTGKLELPGGSVLNEGSSFTGAGLTRMTTGTNTLNGMIYSENLELSGATLAGSGLVTGSFTWSAGTIDAALSFNVTSNSVLTIGSGANFTKFLNGNLTNAGTVIWLPTGSFLLGGVLHNLPGGLFDIRTDSTLGSNGPNALVINDGIFRKSAGTVTAGCWPRLINNGILEISSGRLTCVGGFSNPVGTISLAGGIFQNTDPIHLAGGLLTGWGAVNATVTNSATVLPKRTNGVLTINGNYVQTLAGTTAFELGGNLPVPIRAGSSSRAMHTLAAASTWNWWTDICPRRAPISP